MAKSKISESQYRFKVSLKGRRSVWRSVVLRGDQTLDDLHEIIFTVFDRYDEHLYTFYFPKAPTRRTRSEKQPKEYTAPEGFEPRAFGIDNRYDATNAKLDDLDLAVGQTFEYLFDFGDEWWHDVKVEAIDATEAGGRYPQVVEARGSSPPQYPEDEEEEEEE